MTSFSNRLRSALLSFLYFLPLITGCAETLEPEPQPQAPPAVLKVTRSSRTFTVRKIGHIVLTDRQRPIQYLEQLTFLNDGSFLQVDRVARLIRRFSPEGELIGYIKPLDVEEDKWFPESAGVDTSGTSVLVNGHLGKIWEFDFSKENFFSRYLFENRKLGLRILRSPIGAFYGLITEIKQPPHYTIHLVEREIITKSFLEAGDGDEFLGFKMLPIITFDASGLVYAMRRLEESLFKFTPEGVPLAQWQLVPNEYFRAFQKRINPYKSTRNRDVIREWQKTFTVFSRLEFLEQEGLLIVFARNDPPSIPNMIDVYTPNAEYLGSSDLDGFLVGKDRLGYLYTTSFYIFPEESSSISKYQLEVR